MPSRHRPRQTLTEAPRSPGYLLQQTAMEGSTSVDFCQSSQVTVRLVPRQPRLGHLKPTPERHRKFIASLPNGLPKVEVQKPSPNSRQKYVATNPHYRRRSADLPYMSETERQIIGLLTPDQSPLSRRDFQNDFDANPACKPRSPLSRIFVSSFRKKVTQMRRSFGSEKRMKVPRFSIDTIEDDDDKGAPPRCRLLAVEYDGTHVVQLERRSDQRFGINLQQKVDCFGQLGMYISRLGTLDMQQQMDDLLNLGDEVISVNNSICSKLTLNQVRSMASEGLSLKLQVRSRQFRESQNLK